MSTRDEAEAPIGQTLASLRNQAGLSQKAVADQMRSLGWAWSQATVWSVEKGERPLRFSEALALADFFRIPLVSLSGRPEEKVEPGPSSEQLRAAIDLIAKTVGIDRP